MNTTRTRSTGSRIGNGHVTLYSPTDRRPYYRLDYVDRDGRRCQRSVSRDPVHALTEAKNIDDALSRQHGQAGHRTLGDLAADYTSTARGRMRTPQGRATGRDWQPTQHDDVRRIMRRAVEEVHQVQAWDLDRETIDTMRTACGTFGQVQQMTSTVRNFLRWCEEQGALSAEQVALLPAVNATILAPRFPQPEARPARARLSRLQGQSPDFVGEEDCPSRNDVQSLARALQAAVSWGELAVHTAVGTGLRVGEQFQLTADDIQCTKGETFVRVDWQWSTVPGRRAAPKHRKRRVIPVCVLTRDGYQLERELIARAHAARAEQRAGTNPDALLFPAPAGGMWWASGLLTKLLIPAMKSAGWNYVTVHEEGTAPGLPRI